MSFKMFQFRVREIEKSNFWYYSAVRSFLTAIFVVGLSPYLIKRSEKSMFFVITPIGYVLPFFYLSLYVISDVWCHYTSQDRIIALFFKTQISRLSGVVFSVAQLIYILFMFSNAFISRHTLIDIFHVMFVLDSKFKEIGEVVDFSALVKIRTRGLLILLLLNIGFLIFIIWLFTSNNVHPFFGEYIVFCLPTFYVHFTSIVFLHICLRLQQITECVHKVRIL